MTKRSKQLARQIIDLVAHDIMNNKFTHNFESTHDLADMCCLDHYVELGFQNMNHPFYKEDKDYGIFDSWYYDSEHGEILTKEINNALDEVNAWLESSRVPRSKTFHDLALGKNFNWLIRFHSLLGDFAIPSNNDEATWEGILSEMS